MVTIIERLFLSHLGWQDSKIERQYSIDLGYMHSELFGVRKFPVI